MEKTDNENYTLYPYRKYYIDKPELYFLSKYEGFLKNVKMLDLGIGFGRTTNYFADLTQEYIGTDIQSQAVDFCKQKFKYLKNTKFYVCDAREMKIFEDSSFDVVLFSFNGIDYNSHSDRLLILKEIKRICKENGIVYFSSHNLRNVENLFSYKFATDPLILLYNIRKTIMLRIKNPHINDIIKNISKTEYAIINGSGQNFKLKNYYITPERQIEQLNGLGFTNIKVISLIDGIEIRSKNELEAIKDPWIYYLCQPNKN